MMQSLSLMKLFETQFNGMGCHLQQWVFLWKALLLCKMHKHLVHFTAIVFEINAVRWMRTQTSLCHQTNPLLLGFSSFPLAKCPTGDHMRKFEHSFFCQTMGTKLSALLASQVSSLQSRIFGSNLFQKIAKK